MRVSNIREVFCMLWSLISISVFNNFLKNARYRQVEFAPQSGKNVIMISECPL